VTAPARPEQLDRLESRAATRPTDGVTIDISAVGQPLSWFDPAAVLAGLEPVAERSVAEERAASETVRNPPSSGPVPEVVGGNVQRTIMEQAAATSAWFAQRHVANAMERRSWAQYEDELATWREQLLEILAEQFVQAFHEAGHGQIQLVVANPTGRHLDDVETTFTLPAGIRAVDELPAVAVRPAPPSRWGSDLAVIPRLSSLARFDDASWANLRDGSFASALQPVLEQDGLYIDDEGRIVASVKQLRQHAHVRLDPIWLQLHTGDTVDITWIARIRKPEAVVEGTLRLDVAACSIGVAESPR